MVTNSGFKIRTIIVDAGHGGHDPGAYGAYSVEKNVTLAIAIKLQAAIQNEMKDINVVMTRTTDDFIELHRRSEIANEAKGNLFISIHCNSLPDRREVEKVVKKHGKKYYIYRNVKDRSGKGVLLLVYGFHRTEEELEALRENSSIFQEKDYKDHYDGYDPNDPASFIVLNAFRQKYRLQSIHFANLLNGEFTGTDGRPSDGVKEQGVLVLCHSAMPAVLIETGFINNPKDEDYLNSDAGQNEIVATIIRSIKNYRNEFANKN